MNKIFFILIGAAILGAGWLMVSASQAGTSIVLTPSELYERKVRGESLARVRVAGRVSDAHPITYQTEPAAELTFGIFDPPKDNSVGTASSEGSAAKEIVPVVYKGLRPDMFAPGRDVIIDGYVSDGKLQASSLLTQCPSKYEAPSPEEKYTAGEHPAGGPQQYGGTK